MRAIDAAWLRMDRPTNLAIITSVLWFARPPDWDAVEELLREYELRQSDPSPRPAPASDPKQASHDFDDAATGSRMGD